jgi:DNA-binding winged helix-turn-helix (wHTH) protein
MNAAGAPQLLVAARDSGSRRRLAVALEAAGWSVRHADTGMVAAVLDAAGADVAVVDLTPRRLTLGPLHLDRERQEVRVYGHEVALTRVEYALLDRLCDPPGRVRTRQELISAQPVGRHAAGEHTVDVHLSNLRRKLCRRAPDIRFLHTARGVGFRLSDDLLIDQRYSASNHHR